MEPRPIATFERTKTLSLSCGWNHTLAVSATGDLYTWGQNFVNQLGHGNSTEIASPQFVKSFALIKALHSVRVKYACGGNGHSLALMDNGALFAWGDGNEGQLGLGNDAEEALPRLVPTAAPTPIRAIAVGSAHSMALCEDGAVLTWGCGRYGRLGHQGDNPSCPEDGSKTPRPVTTLVVPIVQIAAGARHSVALDNTGSVWTWGSGSDGCLGLGELRAVYIPTRVDGPEDFASIASGFAHVAAVTREGRLYVWGWNERGQLGLGDTESRYEPAPVELPERVAAVSCGTYHTLAVGESGAVYAWGCNANGQLGLGTSAPQDNMCTRPRVVEALSGHRVTHVACGYTYSVVVAGDMPDRLERVPAPPRKATPEELDVWCINEATRQWIAQDLPHWDAQHKDKRVHAFFAAGLSPHLRHRIWPLAIPNDLKITEPFFEIQLGRARQCIADLAAGVPRHQTRGHRGKDGPSSWNRDILADLPRTYSKMQLFRPGGPLHETLHHLLLAYALWRPDVGYVQGMAFIASTMLIYMSPYKTFTCLAHLLNRHNFLAFVRLGHEEVERYTNVFDTLLFHIEPAAYRLLHNLDLDPKLYLVQWFLTIFSQCMGFSATSRVFDRVLRSGVEALFQIALGVVRYRLPRLQTECREIALSLLQDLSDADETALFAAIDGVTFQKQHTALIAREWI